MIVYCQRCNTNTIELSPSDVFDHNTITRPTCKHCVAFDRIISNINELWMKVFGWEFL